MSRYIKYNLYQEKYVFRLVVSVSPYGDSEIFSLFHACHKTKNIFLYFFTELKTYHLPYSIYKLVSSYLIDTLNIYIISKIYTDSFFHIILAL